MPKRLITALLLLCACILAAQVPVTPIVQPHVTFVDANGNACASCSLYTYAAGTTTPLATYTDSTGTSQNTNPIVLDAAGGAEIWMARNAYKFILKNATGTEIWSADNVTAANLLPCSTANAVQIANSTVTGLTCDATITINTVNHTLNVGTLTANHVSIGALGTPTSWTLDTTSPSTALLSLGKVPSTDITGPNGSTDCLQWDGSSPANLTHNPCSAAVTSVGVSVPTQMTVSGSPITSSGTIALGLNTTGTETKVVTAPTAGTSGNCMQWNASGGAGDSGAPCESGASLLAASGYQTLGSGLIMQWTSGTLQSDSTVTQTVTFPIACTTQVYDIIPSSYESVFVDTQMPVFVVISNTLTDVTLAMQRQADHGYNAATPRIEVLCK